MRLHPNIFKMQQLLAELSHLDHANLLLVEPSDNRDITTVVIRCESKGTWADVMVFPDKFEVCAFSKDDGYLEAFTEENGIHVMATDIYGELLDPTVY